MANTHTPSICNLLERAQKTIEETKKLLCTNSDKKIGNSVDKKTKQIQPYQTL